MTLLSSQVRVEEQEPQIRAIAGVPTSRTAFVGITERGPVGVATLVQNFEEYRRIFGGYLAISDVPNAVESFFAEGGSFAYVVRTVHYIDVTDAGTSTSATGQLDIYTPATSPTSGFVLGSVTGPFDLEHDDQLTIDVDASGPIVPAAAVVTSGNTENFGLANLQDLDVSVNGGPTQNIVFLTGDFGDIANATAAEVADKITSVLVGASGSDNGGAVDITSDWRGEDVTVQVLGGTANAVLGFPTTVQSGSGAVVNAEAAEVTTANTEAFALTDLQDLDVSVNGGPAQNVVFRAAEFADIANASAGEVTDVMNAKLTGVSVVDAAGAVQMITDRRGTSATVQVLGGTANAILGFPTTVQSGAGNVADVDSTTLSEVESIVETAVAGLDVTDDAGRVRITSNTAGASSTIQVAASPMQVALGLPTATGAGGTGAAVATLRVRGRYDGSYTDDVEVNVLESTNKDAARFNLQFVEDGVVRRSEIFANLSMVATDSNYAPDVVNRDPAGGGSHIVLLEDLLAPVPDRAPAQGTFGPLVGGNDGLAGLVDADFVGGSSDAGGKTGIRALDEIHDIGLLTVPDQATPVIHNAMVTYAQITRNGSMFTILDPPSNLTAGEMRTYVNTTALLAELSEHGAMYWPKVKRLNPSPGVYGDVEHIVVAPSGHIAGVYARVDNTRAGVFKVPGGSSVGRLRTAVGVETNQVRDAGARDLLYPENINFINIPDVAPKLPYLDGARTLRSDGPFPTIGQRRGTIFIEVSISRAIDPLRYANITDRLRRQLGTSIKTFLSVLLPDDAFASQVPSEAFTIDVSEALNPPSSIAQRQLIVALGLAYNEPAEFIILQVGRDQRALAAELGLEV